MAKAQVDVPVPPATDGTWTGTRPRSEVISQLTTLGSLAVAHIRPRGSLVTRGLSGYALTWVTRSDTMTVGCERSWRRVPRPFTGVPETDRHSKIRGGVLSWERAPEGFPTGTSGFPSCSGPSPWAVLSVAADRQESSQSSHIDDSHLGVAVHAHMDYSR